MLAHTIELIILPALNKKKIKIIAKAVAANKVLYGNNHTRKYGILEYCLRNLNCARQMLVQISKTVNPGIDII